MSYRGIADQPRSLVGSLLKMLAILLVLALIGGLIWSSYRLSDTISADTMEIQEFEPLFDLSVREVFTGEIGIQLRSSGETRLDRDEVAGLQWFGGYGQVTGLVDTRPGIAVRQFEVLEGEPPAVNDQVFVDHFAYRGDPQSALGIAFTEVSIPGPIGAMPAWHIDGRSDTWAVLVHDRGDRGPAEFLRIMPTIRQAGHPILAITYRNDDQAPRGDARRNTYGIDEAADLEAAVQYALDQGASNVVIVGYGVGGSIALSFVYDSPLAASVSGLVLEAPVTDLERLIYEDLAAEMIPFTQIDLPEQLVWLGLRLSERRWELDFDQADYAARSGELSVSTLLIRNGSDEQVNPDQSDALASRRNDVVQLENFESAGHTRAWNVDSDRYERILVDFLRSLGT